MAEKAPVEKAPVEKAKALMDTSPRWCDFEGYLNNQLGELEDYRHKLDGWVSPELQAETEADVKVYGNLRGKEAWTMSEIEGLISEAYMALNDTDKRKEFMEGYVYFLHRRHFKLLKQEFAAIQKKHDMILKDNS